MDFRTRKQIRTERYFSTKYKVKQKTCYACNGTGRYDVSGSPKCQSCKGKGST